MTRTANFLLTAAFLLAAFLALPTPAHAQPGYGQQTVNCSSNNGRRNYCGQYGNREIRLARQISGSPCVRNQTWGVDGGGLWVDAGCRADFTIGGGGAPPQIVNCSSNNGRRNYCGQYGNRDIRLTRQISGSPCIQGQTWGIDRTGLWVDAGCRADFTIGGGGYGPPPGPPPPQIITCSSNNGKRNWCDTGGRRNIQLSRQISGTPCVQGQTWGIDNRSLWVDGGCRAEFRVR
jgi:hypothetical protein